MIEEDSEKSADMVDLPKTLEAVFQEAKDYAFGNIAIMEMTIILSQYSREERRAFSCGYILAIKHFKMKQIMDEVKP